MKQFIIMSLTLLAFSLISCGKSSDKAQKAADCAKKANHIWDDAGDGECKPETEVPEPNSKPTAELTKEECEAEANQATKEWDATGNVCKDKPAPSPAVGVVTYTITNRLASSAATVTSEKATENGVLTTGVCVTVTEAQWSKLKIVVDSNTVCDNSDTSTDNDCATGSGKVKVLKKSTGNPATNQLLDKVEEDADTPEECKALVAPATL